MKWLKIFLLSSPLFICALGLFGLSGDASAWSLDEPFFTNTTVTLVRSAGSQADGAPYIQENRTTENFDLSNYIFAPTDSAIQQRKLFAFSLLGFSLTGGDSSKKYQSAQAVLYLTTNKAQNETIDGSIPSYAYYYKQGGGYDRANCTINSFYSDTTPSLLLAQIECKQVSNSDYKPYISVDFQIGSSFTNISYSDPAFYTYINGGGIKVSATKGQYIVSSTDNASELALEQVTQGLSILQEQNSTIINQNTQLIQGQEAINDWLTDDTAPSADTSSLGNAAGWLPPGPLDSILNLPIQFIQGVIGVFTNSNTCSPIVLPIGIVNYNLEIPCMRPFFELASVNIVWNTVGTIISAILIFNTLKWLYKFVDDTLSFRENNSTMWGGL